MATCYGALQMRNRIHLFLIFSPPNLFRLQEFGLHGATTHTYQHCVSVALINVYRMLIHILHISTVYWCSELNEEGHKRIPQVLPIVTWLTVPKVTQLVDVVHRSIPECFLVVFTPEMNKSIGSFNYVSIHLRGNTKYLIEDKHTASSGNTKRNESVVES